jgi:hypothetical protein
VARRQGQALLTAAGLLTAVYTALAVGTGARAPGWLTAMAAIAMAPVVVALVLLLVAPRPRLSTAPDPTSFINYGPTELKPHLAVRRDTVVRIAAYKYRLIAAAVDLLIGGVAVGAAVAVIALLN